MNKAIKIISLIGKFAGIVAGLNTIPGVSPQTGLYIFAAETSRKARSYCLDELTFISLSPRRKSPACFPAWEWERHMVCKPALSRSCTCNCRLSLPSTR